MSQHTGLQRPTLLHVKTEKGFGYGPALAAPDRMHGVEPAPHLALHAGSSLAAAAAAAGKGAAAGTGAAGAAAGRAGEEKQAATTAAAATARATAAAAAAAIPPRPLPSLTSVAAKEILRLAAEDPLVVGVTAAMPGGTGLSLLGAQRPSQLYDVGIAEQHAVTFCGGLAADGAKPFCCIYSTFLQRAYDQIVHDIALQNLPVRSVKP